MTSMVSTDYGSKTARVAVLEYLASKGAAGATDAEGVDALGLDTYCHRLALTHAGLVVCGSGQRYRLTAAARRNLNEIVNLW